MENAVNMKSTVKYLTLALVTVAMTLPASASFAQDREDWLDKGFGFGIGAGHGVVQNGTTGLSVRMFPAETFGLELVLGGGRDKRSVTTPAMSPTQPETKRFRRDSHFDVSLFGDFRFLRSNRSALSAYVGLGISAIGAAETFDSTIVPGAVVTGKDSVIDFAMELGLRGEIFLYEFFSVHGRIGINMNPHTNNETPVPTNPELGTPTANPFAPDVGGMDVSIFDTSNLLGMFGFTVWFN